MQESLHQFRHTQTQSSFEYLIFSTVVGGRGEVRKRSISLSVFYNASKNAIRKNNGSKISLSHFILAIAFRDFDRLLPKIRAIITFSKGTPVKNIKSITKSPKSPYYVGTIAFGICDVMRLGRACFDFGFVWKFFFADFDLYLNVYFF